ncbi:MAG: glucose-6-phosphate isomerase [Cyanophyceae cyanobacterium]
MQGDDLWQRYQDWLYYHPDLKLYLDISRIQFEEAQVAELEAPFAKAFAEMQSLELGSIANPDERRQVGHYWLRSPQLAPREDIKQNIEAAISRIEQFARDIHQGVILTPQGQPFRQLLWIGIGGSALGPQFVSAALAEVEPPLGIHFVDNTDPDGIDRILAGLGSDLDQTLVAVVSKSGGTPEPNNGMAEVRAAVEGRGLNWAGHAVAVTSPGSKLEELARSQGWMSTFPIFDWVGGRTSIMSSVGLLPAALQGIDIREFLVGAAVMDAATRIPGIKSNPAALLALAWYVVGQGQGLKDMVVLPYKDRLLLFSRYLQQLVMESLGKELDLNGNRVNQGIAVYGNKGSTDQHAYVQQLRDGVPNFFATFIEVLQDRTGESLELDPGVTAGDYLNGFLQGTRGALYDNGRDSITVTINAVDPRSVGALIALYERAVGLYASLININAYHQPGVEAGKAAAGTVLDLQHKMLMTVSSSQGSLTLAELAAQLGTPDQVETLYLIARHLDANQRSIQLIGDPAQPGSLRISARE